MPLAKRETNQAATLRGEPVTTMAQFGLWRAVTMWPDDFDTAEEFLRDFGYRAEDMGLNWHAFRVQITDGKTNFKSVGLDGTAIDTRVWCYRVKFYPPFPVDAAEPMFGLYVPYDPQHEDKRTNGAIPVYPYHHPELIIANDL
jgi:hypothetical protein